MTLLRHRDPTLTHPATGKQSKLDSICSLASPPARSSNGGTLTSLCSSHLCPRTPTAMPPDTKNAGSKSIMSKIHEAIHLTLAAKKCTDEAGNAHNVHSSSLGVASAQRMAQLLTENNETTASGVGVDETHDNNDSTSLDDELRKMLADIFVDNARLRKQVNSVTRHALRVDIMSKKEDKEAASRLSFAITPSKAIA
uniref:Uncharacterized protein n=1 Tax=Fagus sylvatica TaxID=28930 RepID=A0A2N9FTA3_FAGSY